MRVEAYTLLVVVGVGSVAGFAACGGEVTVAPTGTAAATGASVGAGGAGGAGGATTTSSTTQTSTTVGPSTSVVGPGPTASASSGGGTKCEQACDHVQMCTGFTCSQANVDCSTVGMQFD